MANERMVNKKLLETKVINSYFSDQQNVLYQIDEFKMNKPKEDETMSETESLNHQPMAGVQ